ncbi:hypothetical protein C8J57DRAFT_1299053 [Mycena rebaudengoi]|nr:hypothetical protein C8J57DRAFT_1299053 [Mycena rebaudengoi]
MSDDPAVIWDKRDIQHPRFIPSYIDVFVRAQIREQVPCKDPYTPVAWDEIQTLLGEASSSSRDLRDLKDAPFICAITFVRIANSPSARLIQGRRPQACVKVDKTLISLIPGHTKTPCTMFLPASKVPPNIFEGSNDRINPTIPVGLLNEGLELEYMFSYWKKVPNSSVPIQPRRYNKYLYAAIIALPVLVAFYWSRSSWVRS